MSKLEELQAEEQKLWKAWKDAEAQSLPARDAWCKAHREIQDFQLREQVRAELLAEQAGKKETK